VLHNEALRARQRLRDTARAKIEKMAEVVLDAHYTDPETCKKAAEAVAAAAQAVVALAHARATVMDQGDDAVVAFTAADNADNAYNAAVAAAAAVKDAKKDVSHLFASLDAVRAAQNAVEAADVAAAEQTEKLNNATFIALRDARQQQVITNAACTPPVPAAAAAIACAPRSEYFASKLLGSQLVARIDSKRLRVLIELFDEILPASTNSLRLDSTEMFMLLRKLRGQVKYIVCRLLSCAEL
jgi:hypothetical protein